MRDRTGAVRVTPAISAAVASVVERWGGAAAPSERLGAALRVASALDLATGVRLAEAIGAPLSPHASPGPTRSRSRAATPPPWVPDVLGLFTPLEEPWGFPGRLRLTRAFLPTLGTEGAPVGPVVRILAPSLSRLVLRASATLSSALSTARNGPPADRFHAVDQALAETLTLRREAALARVAKFAERQLRQDAEAAFAAVVPGDIDSALQVWRKTVGTAVNDARTVFCAVLDAELARLHARPPPPSRGGSDAS